MLVFILNYNKFSNIPEVSSDCLHAGVSKEDSKTNPGDLNRFRGVSVSFSIGVEGLRSSAGPGVP
jgi:hypothetical protein